ncbi:hypothetical protein [Bradyrhizobium sp. Leo121]|uniref:hypothetical protein n=1 Tax=Bradyrhizobium sp. Leo121 TaxID=1571195 RepID=UPI0013EF3800|nr:hypothetical protein [Bradyrhizobium sp. Leo121]
MNGEVDVRRSLRQDIDERRHISLMMAQNRDGFLREIVSDISVMWRIKPELGLRALLDRSSYPLTLLLCRHRKQEHRIRELFPRHASQLSNPGLDVSA